MKFNEYMGEDFLGAGIVFRTPENKILILQKNNNKWSFPGGHREKGETPIHTAKRECIEEIGSLPDGNIVEVVPYIKTENKGNCYSFIMDVGKEFIPTLSNEHKDYKWLDPKELDNLVLSGAVLDLWPNLKRYLI